MPYKVQFVGLVCFYRENGSRLVLLPDGRDPALGLDRHIPSLYVAPESVQESSGWPSDDETSHGIFRLPECALSMEGTDVPGTLDVAQHDGVLPQLKRIDEGFKINPDTVEAVARLRIRQGKLVARRVPNGQALMSELEVPHDRSITVTVTPRDGAPRTLRLAQGTEILLGNMAAEGLYAEKQPSEGHFRIYQKLSENPVNLPGPGPVKNVTESDSQHWLFKTAGPVNLSVSCSNTGCC